MLSKKYFLALIFFVCTPLAFYAQRSDTSTIKENRFSIGVSFSPDYCSAITSGTYFNLGANFLPNQIPSSAVVPKPGYSYNLTLKYRIGKKLWLRTGFTYRNVGFQTTTQTNISYAPPFMSSIYFFYITPYTSNYNGVHYTIQNISNARLVYSNLFYGIPLLIDYKIRTKSEKLFFTVSLGGEIDYFHYAQANIVTDNDKVVHTFDTRDTATVLDYAQIADRRPHLTIIFSSAINYKLNSHINIALEPSFRYIYMSFGNYEWGLNYYSLGINLGCNYSF